MDPLGPKMITVVPLWHRFYCTFEFHLIPWPGCVVFGVGSTERTLFMGKLVCEFLSVVQPQQAIPHRKHQYG
jgi:hypothetical protein